ncbi:MAG: site-specific DNA-methyltransferase, partial [Planctomycetes bacterium]|nr:site-specific DNA-methyltransferase [Planctomycetota bacterium]
AKRLGRDAILIDASADYCEMARKRTGQDVTAEMFA